MVQVRQLYVALAAVAAALPLAAQPAPQVDVPRYSATKFYPDDPLAKAPRPREVINPKKIKLNDIYDLFLYTLTSPGETHPKNGPPIRAMATNTLDEMPDIPWWYENRHWKRRMSTQELVLAAGANNAPSREGPWKVISLKDQGVTPGFLMEDSRGQRYFIKFDPITNPEMATAADVISSRFFYALGYFVPEYYIVRFDRDQLVVGKGATMKFGDKKIPITDLDISRVLSRLARDADGRFRAVASTLVPGELLGPFRYSGTRQDDPNDVFPHEHRRELRGLYVFCAWLAHDDSRSINTLDTLIDVEGVKVIRHDLIDFGSTLGSASTKPNPARSGNQHLFAWKPAMVQFFTLGLYVPEWERFRFNYMPSVGRFEWELFDPDRYYPEYPNPAFNNRLPDDEFWAAKQVMNFTDEEIAAIVKTGQYSDPKAEAFVIECLRQRRDKIGRTFFSKVLPLDRFEVSGGKLTYVDLAEYHRLFPAKTYAVTWSEFDNGASKRKPLPDETSFTLPAALQSAAPGTYWVADIRCERPGQTTAVYLRKTAGGAEVVGIERYWPEGPKGRTIASAK
jgi:hypothetical protein